MMHRLALTGAFAVALAASAAQAAPSHWLQTWGAPPAPAMATSPIPGTASPALEGQTLLQVVRISAGGRRVRVRFTNEYGQIPLAIGAARVALLGPDGAPLPGGDRTLTFGGLSAISVPVGAPMLSDPVDLPVKALGSLQVALYIAGKAPACTCHVTGGERVKVSRPGDFTQAPFTPVMTGGSAPIYRAYLSGVEVEDATPRPVIVTFGDSITDGYQSTIGANRRWPDRLAERLVAADPRRPAAVVNEGLSGNQVLTTGPIVAFGQSALTRFDRDVLSVPGATHLIVLEGVNDLGMGGAHPPSASSLIAGYRQIIARAHGQGITVIGGTIVPYEGAAYFKPEGEAVRAEVNRWIRTSGEFDGVVDFDTAIRDPAKPTKMRADLQSGDWLHPNDAGYRVMGDAVDLGLFPGPLSMAAAALPGLDAWYVYMRAHDHAALWELLHPDAVFESPVVHTPQRGRDITFKYLASADAVLGGPSFRYVGEWRNETSAVLEFMTEIEGVTINGIDMMTFSEDGEKIIHFKVMVRPLKAINLLHRLMGEQLTKG